MDTYFPQRFFWNNKRFLEPWNTYLPIWFLNLVLNLNSVLNLDFSLSSEFKNQFHEYQAVSPERFKINELEISKFCCKNALPINIFVCMKILVKFDFFLRFISILDFP